MSRELDDRYEPLPGLLQLPGYVWRRLPRAAKLAVVAASIGAVALAIALRPNIERGKREHARQEAARSARIERQIIEQTRREQRPRFGRGAAAGADPAARRRLVASAAASIRADANTRAAAGEFHGPVLRVQCEGYPVTAGDGHPEEHLSLRSARYTCLAVTSDIPATEGNRPGVVGHFYRARINFANGRYAFCKIRGRPGEMAIKRRKSVPVPRVCGG